jgi:hypothetical protein
LTSNKAHIKFVTPNPRSYLVLLLRKSVFKAESFSSPPTYTKKVKETMNLHEKEKKE